MAADARKAVDARAAGCAHVSHWTPRAALINADAHSGTGPPGPVAGVTAAAPAGGAGAGCEHGRDRRPGHARGHRMPSAACPRRLGSQPDNRRASSINTSASRGCGPPSEPEAPGMPRATPILQKTVAAGVARGDSELRLTLRRCPPQWWGGQQTENQLPAPVAPVAPLAPVDPVPAVVRCALRRVEERRSRSSRRDHLANGARLERGTAVVVTRSSRTRPRRGQRRCRSGSGSR